MELATHQTFYAKTSSLASELKQIENQVKEQEQILISKVSNVVSRVESVASSCSGETSVEQAIQGHLEQVSAIISEWQNRVRNYENNLEFRKDFGDSLLVFVYGKVKAGKSTLGNYIATGREKPDLDWFKKISNTLHQPDFFFEKINEEFGERVNHDEGFAVGAAETTSCIQGFRVPGFTWVDSPGLHSVTKENGDLAKQYVESADLIIYPMNSAQPGRGTDLQELEKLILTNKRILLLITRCDEKEIDVDDEGNIVERVVMKDAEDRRAQENYVKDELDNICKRLDAHGVDTSAITVSVLYAESGRNTQSAMDESGISALFDKFGSVIDSEAIDLKKKAPEKNMQAFYSALLSDSSDISIKKINQPLKDAINTIDNLEQDLLDKTAQVKSSIQLEFSFELDNLVEKYAGSRDVKALSREINSFISQVTINTYQPIINRICQDAVGSMETLTSEMKIDNDITFEDKVTQKEIDVTLKHTAVGSGVGAIAGGVIGFFVGGPAGAAIGATVGSTAGGVAGGYMSSKELVDVVYGDNREEIKDSLLILGHKVIEENLARVQNSVNCSVFQPIKGAFDEISNETTNLESYIRGQVKNV